MNDADLIDRWNNAIKEVIAWSPHAHLERAQGTQFHHALTALLERDLVRTPQATEQEHEDWYRKALEHPFQVFVIEHDWAAAFADAEDFANKDDWPVKVDFRLPYPECCFEFQFSGKRLCVLSRFDGKNHAWSAIVRTTVGWLFFALSEPAHAEISRRVRQTIRAASIALDAAVAEIEVVRAPHKLNKQRERRGRPLVADYHSIRLARRSRPAPLPNRLDETGRRLRLHFRRGHWRHFETHKTWIRWTLVGDPDLGFIDKHYRL